MNWIIVQSKVGEQKQKMLYFIAIPKIHTSGESTVLINFIEKKKTCVTETFQSAISF